MLPVKSLLHTTLTYLYNIQIDLPLTPAPKPELGEYCINVFPLAKKVGKNPHDIAQEVAGALGKYTDVFVAVTPLGGYINFFFTDTLWYDLFHTPPPTYQKRNATLIVDYIGANVGKPLHIGHLCTPSIGQALINSYREYGYTVLGDSHFGDWGGIFGKIIFALKYFRSSCDTGLPNGATTTQEEQALYARFRQQTPTESTEDYYLTACDYIEKNASQAANPTESADAFLRRIHCYYIIATYLCEHSEAIDAQCRKEFQKLSQGDSANLLLWQYITSSSIHSTNTLLQQFNVAPDYTIGESFYEGISLPQATKEAYPPLNFSMKDIVQELIEKKIAVQNADGSVGVLFPEETKIPSCILQKKDGTGLYLTSDLATIKYRLTNGWNPEKIIYCVDVRQSLHLRQVFWIAKQAWDMEHIELIHAGNGFIKLKDGAMSTRKGKVILLRDLLYEGLRRTKALLATKNKVLTEKDSMIITVGAIKYAYLSQDREKDSTFDWDKALNFEGNSGPYIQYACVRGKKLLEAFSQKKTIENDNFEEKYALTRHEKILIQKLDQTEEKFREMLEKEKPHIFALALYELSVVFNSFYVHTPKILEEKNVSLQQFRFALVEKTVYSLQRGFRLLGMEVPAQM